MKRSSIVFLIIILAVLVMMAVVGIKMRTALKEQELTTFEETLIPVEVFEVSTGHIEDIIDLTGWIEADKQVNLIAKLMMPGKLIRNVLKEGDLVRKNQVVSWVDRDEVGAKAPPYPVKSPISGVVSKILSDPGDVIVAQLPVAVVVDINKVIVKTSVIEKDFGKMRTGLIARVQTQTYPEKVFEGKVTEIAPTLDQFSHTANIEIKIPNRDHLLRPGMYAKIQLVVASKENATIIPKSAVFKDEGDDMVFMVSSDLVQLQKVTLGYYDLHNYEVLEGLEPGQLVVARDQAILQDGTKVTIARTLSREDIE